MLRERRVRLAVVGGALGWLMISAAAKGQCIGGNCGACSTTGTGTGTGTTCSRDVDCTVLGETCGGKCKITAGLCTTNFECPIGGTCSSGTCTGTSNACSNNSDCVNACYGPDGRASYPLQPGGTLVVSGGQVSGAGATLFSPFFRATNSTNDWNDVNGDGCSGFNPPPGTCSGGRIVDQLGPNAFPFTGIVNSWWNFQYRSVGSVNGFNEFVNNQLCGVIETSVPSEAGIFNTFEFATNGNPTWGGPYDNNSATPLAPREIEFAFVDVPSKWAVRVPGEPKWSRRPLQPGYGLNDIPSNTIFFSNLLPLDRDCDGDTVIDGSLNTNTTSPDEDTIFDLVASFVPVVPIANRGAGVRDVKYTELQHLFTTGRMPNGENFASSTRDVGSGTRNAEMNSLGIDTSWGRGDNLGHELPADGLARPGANHQNTNCGSSGIVETAVENRRLAIGYTGIGGSGRAASDASAGRYEILNVCKDVATRQCSGNAAPCESDKDCPVGQTCNVVVPACNCTAQACGITADRQVATPNNGYVRPAISTVLDNCDPCCGFTLGGNGTFSVRGNPDANRFPPTSSDPRLDNQAVADYMNNVFDSIASFTGGVQAGTCFFTATGCSTDANCPGTFCAIDLTACAGSCSDAVQECSAPTGGTCDITGEPCTGGPGPGDCPNVPQSCEPDFCRLKANMPGDYLATTFFLPNGIDCTQTLEDGVRFEPTVGFNQSLQNFIRSNNGLGIGSDTSAFGSVNEAGRTPNRRSTAAPGYSDGSTTGSWTYWNGASYVTNFGAGVNLAKRNRIAGDMNEDCIRDVNDADQLVEAYRRPRTWQQSAAGINTGGGCYGSPNAGAQTSGGSVDGAIPEITADFNGDGSLTKEDLRYFMDGLSMDAGQLDRKAGAIAIDTALTVRAMPLPWADPNVYGDVTPGGLGVNPTINPPATPIANLKATGAAYVAGDFRGDVAGRVLVQTCVLPVGAFAGACNITTATGCNGNINCPSGEVCLIPTAPFAGKCNIDRASCNVSGDCAGVSAEAAGADPRGWDGRIDGKDIDYCCRHRGNWSELNEAVSMDLSCDMDGDVDVDDADITELLVTILGTQVGDVDLDDDVDSTDGGIIDNSILTPNPCIATATCGWSDGDLNCDGVVDGNDLAAAGFAPTSPTAFSPFPEGRSFAFTPVPVVSDADMPPTPVAYRVTVGANEYWVGPPSGLIASLQCTPFFTSAWPTPTRVVGQEIVPLTTYSISATFNGTSPHTPFSTPPFVVTMPKYGDVVGVVTAGAYTAPNGIIDFVDIGGAVDGFKNLPSAPAKIRINVHPMIADGVIDFLDIGRLVDAFKGLPYPYPARRVCPF